MGYQVAPQGALWEGKMAAHLKKRAYEEFSHVIQEEVKPPKKLKLARKPSPEEVLDLSTAKTPQAAVQLLLRFSNNLPDESGAVEGAVRHLLEFWYKEKESYVRSKIAQLLGRLAHTPGFAAAALVDDLTSLLQAEESHQVRAQLLDSLLQIGRGLPLHQDLHRKLVTIAQQFLTDTYHLVRSKCLELIGCLGTAGVAGKGDLVVERILADASHDQDPRVRTSALLAMLTLHQRGLKLSLGGYQQACSALTDDYEGVRLAAVKLIWVYSQLYPETMIPVPSSNEELRLVDDGFAKICNMVNDLTMTVRAEAAGLLGSLHRVSERFLEQTLDKKLMSHLRRKRTAHERAKELYARGEWSTGKKWGDDAPKEEVDTDSISLIDSGACGAFVHGLEDEFLEVRNASVDSLCELSSNNPTFAHQSLDFLVDMLNDEIDGVRLNSIRSLRKISRHVVLREDQLDTVLGALDDASKPIREALHELLCSCQQLSKACLNSTIHAMLRNLSKYPSDRLSIWRCMQQVGSHHADLVATLTPDLLCAHPYFDATEPDMDDPAYIAILILVFNAAVSCPTLQPMFPQHTLRHYDYLRDSLTELVPQLKLEGHRSILMSPDRQRRPSLDDHGSFLQHILSRLGALLHMQHGAAVELLQMTIRDLERVGSLEPQLTATAACTAMYLHCHMLFRKALSDQLWAMPAALGAVQCATVRASVRQMLELTHQMEQLFLGLSSEEVGCVLQMRLKAHTLQLLVDLRGRQAGAKGTKTSSQLCELYLQRVTDVQSYLTSNKVAADSFTQALLAEMSMLESSKASLIAKYLLPLIQGHIPPAMEIGNCVRQARADIAEPSGESDNVQRFTAGLALAIDVDATLDNVTQAQDVLIQLKFPDGETQLTSVRPADIHRLGPLRHRVLTQVYLSHQQWTEPCHVELGMVLPYSGRDQEEEEEGGAAANVIPLCKPVKVYILPTPTKR
ncbi:integrator complex subunit 4-like isoform X1 [Branchiostoma floridae x Branchiostoma belcheri]